MKIVQHFEYHEKIIIIKCFTAPTVIYFMSNKHFKNKAFTQEFMFIHGA